MMFGLSFCDLSSILMSVGVLFYFTHYYLRLTTLTFETRAKPGNPTSTNIYISSKTHMKAKTDINSQSYSSSAISKIPRTVIAYIIII